MVCIWICSRSLRDMWNRCVVESPFSAASVKEDHMHRLPGLDVVLKEHR